MKLNRALLLLFCAFVSLVLGACKDEEGNMDVKPDLPSTSSPNVLLIIADDMGKDATPNYPEGSIKPNMPNLQSIIQSGITFDNSWVAPLCAPTRAAILSGKYGYNNGVLDVQASSRISDDEYTIHQYLDDQTNEKYTHAVIGKWHLSGRDASAPTNLGVDHFSGLMSGGVQSYTNWALVENEVFTTSTEYSTTKFTDLAIDWIAEQDKPWFCWLAYNAPHTPFHLPPSHMHNQGDLDNIGKRYKRQPYAILHSNDGGDGF